ncbi:MAG: hypothetical protein ABII01_01620 [Candidatus Woesearchaeota archaeon]
MFIEFLIVIIGCIFIILLANLVVKISIILAEQFGLSSTFVGMTILSVGTSLPEIVTHVIGSLKILAEPSSMNTVSALVIGTNIGSDIFQQNFILGIVAILGTVFLLKKEINPSIGGLIGGSVILLVFSLNGIISRGEGIFLVLGYVAYIFYLEKSGFNTKLKKKTFKGRYIIIDIFLLIISFIIIAFFAEKVLDSAQILVKSLPISASFFGIIIIGIAAALPELTTALVALKEKRNGMSAGVLIGSNVTNPTLALGLGAMISTYRVPDVVIIYDLPVKIISSLLILVLLLKYKRLGKIHAVILISMFLAYLIIRNIFFPVDF